MEFAPGQFNESAHFWTSSPEAKNDISVEGEVVWIRLTQGKCACIDLADWGRVREYRWFAHKCRYGLYAKTSIGGRKDRRVVGMWHIVLQVDPSQLCDHEYRNGLDNRRINIRVASVQQNQANRSGWNYLGLPKGVRPLKNSRNRFTARITFNRKSIHIGCFGSVEEAAKAYDAKAKELFGEFARLNFPHLVATVVAHN